MPSTDWWESFDAQGRAMLLDPPANPGGDPGPGDPPSPPLINTLHPAVSPRLITGLAIPGAPVQIVIDEVPYTTVVADQVGEWAISVTATYGTYSIEARQQGDDEQWSEYSIPVLFVILPDPGVPDSSGYDPSFEEKKERDAIPLVVDEVAMPEVGRISVPFRRPRSWPSDKGH